MRVLILESMPRLAQILPRELGERFELRSCGSLAEAMLLLGRHGWRVDAVIAELALPDGDGSAVIDALERLAPGVPLLPALADVAQLRRQLEALIATARDDERPLPRTLFGRAEGRLEILAEIDVVARRAAEQAVSQAVERLIARLGLDDEDGLRDAVKLARTYENARVRFWSAITSGLASGFLVAMGVGLLAIARSSTLVP